MRSQGGFTLIEILAALLILGILTVAVTVSLRGAGQHARLSEAMERLTYRDQMVRQYARRCGRPQQLVYRIQSASVLWVDAQSQRPQGQELGLPEGFGLECVVVHGRQVRSGEVVVACSPLGLTPSYALLVRGANQQRQWLVIAGLSGQPMVIDDDKVVEAMLQETVPHGPQSRSRPIGREPAGNGILELAGGTEGRWPGPSMLDHIPCARD